MIVTMTAGTLMRMITAFVAALFVIAMLMVGGTADPDTGVPGNGEPTTDTRAGR